MIVCSCNVLSQTQILAAIARSRPARRHQVYACLGCSPRCGQCMATIRRIWDDASPPVNGCQGGKGDLNVR
jgi:bacterioferritin-associated ferredoxin